MALEALDAVDLTRVALVSTEERMVRDTTITMSRVQREKLKKIADESGQLDERPGEHRPCTLAREKGCTSIEVINGPACPRPPSGSPSAGDQHAVVIL